MKKTLVAKSNALNEGDRLIVHVDRDEVGIFRHRGALRAYSNYCLHSGGPACEGLIIARIEEHILPDKTSAGLFFSKDQTHFVCPWHGYEYDMQTGDPTKLWKRTATSSFSADSTETQVHTREDVPWTSFQIAAIALPSKS